MAFVEQLLIVLASCLHSTQSRYCVSAYACNSLSPVAHARVAKKKILHLIDKWCLSCSLVEGELLDEYMSNAHEKQNPKQYVETVKNTLKKMLQVCSNSYSHCLPSALHCYGSYVVTVC